MGEFIDMTGWKMWEHGVPGSRLTVIKRTDDRTQPNGKNVVMWLCECSCEKHTLVEVAGSHLRAGHTQSCGCYEADRKSETHKKYNKYDLSGEYGIGWTTNTNKEFYFDLEDYEKIKYCCWNEIVHKCGYHYLYATDCHTGKKFRFHQMLELGWELTDHIDRNPLNNRKENLRPATHTENARNSSISKNNTSGFTGVYMCKQNNWERWRAEICVNKNRIVLGHFIDKTDAIKARLEAEAKYYGEFAPQRHLFAQYGITQQNNLG